MSYTYSTKLRQPTTKSGYARAQHKTNNEPKKKKQYYGGRNCNNNQENHFVHNSHPFQKTQTNTHKHQFYTPIKTNAPPTTHKQSSFLQTHRHKHIYFIGGFTRIFLRSIANIYTYIYICIQNTGDPDNK